MTKFATAAALLAALLLTATTTAHADIVVLRDGKVLPAKVADQVTPGQVPSDAALQDSSRSRVTLRFDTVTIGKDKISAALVQDVYSTNCERNANFANGANQGSAGWWQAAARSFAAAAEELKDGDKQIAAWWQVLCMSNTGDVAATAQAVTSFLEAFPDGYYMPEARVTLTRVLINQKKTAEAQKQLELISTTAGMNARDKYDAIVTLVDFFEFPKARTPEQFAAVGKRYAGIVRMIKTKGAATEAAIPLMKAEVGIGRALIGERKPDEASAHFDAVTSNPASSADQGLLASAYRGMGDVIFLQVGKKVTGTDKDSAAAKALVEELDQAALHYMRVFEFYRDSAGDNLQPAMQNCGQVWQWQFDMTGSKDLPLANRAISRYVQSYQLLGRGQKKRDLGRHIKQFISVRDDLRTQLEGPADDGSKDN